MSGKIEIFGTTDVGQQRDHNEDNFVICQNVSTQQWQFKKDQVIDLGELGAMLMVADGMGGTNAGEVASDIAQQTVKEIFSDLEALPSSIPHFLQDVIVKAHKAIVAYAKANPECQGMGTTAVIAWLIGNDLHIGWSGDSRAYIYRPGEGMIQANEDHSMVWEMVKSGTISREEAWDHPESNIITQSLGDPYNTPKPDALHHVVKSGDRIIVCSDGLNAMLRDEEIAQIAASGMSTADTCKHLVERSNLAGGHDNITVLMLDAKELPPPVDSTKDAFRAGMTTTEITSQKLGRKNLMIALLALLVVALLGVVFKNSITGIFYEAPVVDSTQLRNDSVKNNLPEVDTTAHHTTDSLPIDKEYGGGNKETAEKPVNILPNPSPSPKPNKPVDTVKVAGRDTTTKTPAEKSPLDLLAEQDSLNKLGVGITPIPPTREEFEAIFAKIVDLKVKSANLSKCMLVDNVRAITEQDKTAIIKIEQERKAIEPKILSWVTFASNGKLDKIKKQSNAELLQLETLTRQWKQQYELIHARAKGILEHYKDKKVYTNCDQ